MLRRKISDHRYVFPKRIVRADVVQFNVGQFAPQARSQVEDA